MQQIRQLRFLLRTNTPVRRKNLNLRLLLLENSFNDEVDAKANQEIQELLPLRAKLKERYHCAKD
jgi:hypothetical protein